LIFKGEENTVKVRSFKAGYVNQFKKINRINNFTHSYESLDYKRKERILYTGENIDLKNQKLEIMFKSQEKEYVVKLALIKETEKTPVEIKRRNSALINILSNIEKIDFTKFLDLPFMNYIEEDKAIFEQVKKLDIPKNLKEDIELILTYVKAQVEKERIKKNRNNHLHHALDAVSVAVITKSTEQKLAEYEKRREEAITKINKGPLEVTLNNQTKVIQTIDEFEKIELKYLEEYIPKPFTNFQKEILAYIYERDSEEQKAMLADDKYRNIKPLLPVIKKKRRYDLKNLKSQKLHLDTVYGRSGDMLVKRIAVKDLDNKKLEKIIGKNSYALTTYEACKAWIKDKEGFEYPMLPNGRAIKKVKIEDGHIKKALKIERGYVLGDNVVRIDIYRSKNKEDNNLYFLGQNAMTIIQDYQDKEINQVLWYGQGEKYNELTNKEIKEKYTLLKHLHPGDLVELTKKDDKYTLAYIKGFSSGMLEVESVLGDNYDLNKHIDMKLNRSQCYISVSTIKQINKKQINIMGQIKKWVFVKS
ncbi:MAG: hypothetical protein ACK5HR_03050, partial [Mycoplasmatales bacterium]